MAAIETVGTVAGLVVAIALFGLSWWMVRRARTGNAKVRKTQHDPHLDPAAHGDDTEDPQRDIPQ